MTCLGSILMWWKCCRFTNVASVSLQIMRNFLLCGVSSTGWWLVCWLWYAEATILELPCLPFSPAEVLSSSQHPISSPFSCRHCFAQTKFYLKVVLKILVKDPQNARQGVAQKTVHWNHHTLHMPSAVFFKWTVYSFLSRDWLTSNIGHS